MLLLLGALVCSIFLPTSCTAQENSDAPPAEPSVDAEGCSDLTVFPKLATSIIVTCHGGDSVEVSMPLKPDAAGNAHEKTAKGPYEFREYRILQEDQQEQAFANLLELLPIAGFTVKHSYSPSTITARNEDTWILINVNGDFYNVTVVREKAEPWNPVKDATEISREMENNDRVAVYGIQFSPDNHTIIEDDSAILFEVVKYLTAAPNVAVIVESHKTSEKGSSEEDQDITKERANAVVAWLESHAIAAKRLRPKGMGRSKPITKENDTPSEIQRNERIELVKDSAHPSSSPDGRHSAYF
jgi:outer membrane protein OmpA-like peptidoglycan-associated protein